MAGDLSKAVIDQEAADRAYLSGAYARAADLFEQAAANALTPEGAAVLLEKARDARAHIERTDTT